MEGHDQASQKESGDNKGLNFACYPNNQWKKHNVSTAVAAESLFNTA